MPVSEVHRFPPNTDNAYVTARNSLAEAEYALSKQIESVAALCRALPVGAIMKKYTFHALNGEKKTLADLAADGRSVVIYHLMFTPEDEEPCGMCGLFVDSQNGVGKQLGQHVNFAVVAKAPIEKLDAYAKKRGWTNLLLLSSFENGFNQDMNVEKPNYAPDWKSAPGVSVFREDGDGNVRHLYSQTAAFELGTERGMDLLCPVWGMLDLIPEGRGNWYADNEYVFN